jgi:hypothetical protein
MKTLKTIALVLFGVLISTAGYAQQVPKKVVVGPPKVDKFQARKVLHRTSIVIYYAHKQVKASKNYTGDLAKSMHGNFTCRESITEQFITPALPVLLP